MSVIGTRLDALIDHAIATDGAFTGNTTRGVLARYKINDEDYPHFFAFNPSYAATRLPYRQRSIVSNYPVSMLVKGETQEELLGRVEAFIARIEGDRTLGGEVELADVSSVALFEDPRTKEKLAELVVTTSEYE